MWACLYSPEAVEQPMMCIRDTKSRRENVTKLHLRPYLKDRSGDVSIFNVSDSKTENHLAWKISHQWKNITPGIPNSEDSCVFSTCMSWSGNEFSGCF